MQKPEIGIRAIVRVQVEHDGWHGTSMHAPDSRMTKCQIKESVKCIY